MGYLRAREERLRDTNESTNRRVRNFSIGIIIALVGFGLWQVAYLRSYFRYVLLVAIVLLYLFDVETNVISIGQNISFKLYLFEIVVYSYILQKA